MWYTQSKDNRPLSRVLLSGNNLKKLLHESTFPIRGGGEGRGVY